MGADREEGGIEAPGLHRLEYVGDLGVEPQLDAEGEDAGDFGIEHVARETVLRDAEAHHAARTGPASWITTSCPARARWYAAESPEARRPRSAPAFR